MLESILKKIEQIYEQCLYHEKYVQNYDALSLASFTLNDNNEIIDGNIPDLPGWEKLSKDIVNVLDEGNIILQQLNVELDQQIRFSIHDRYELLKRVALEQISDDNEKLKVSVMHKDIRHNLRNTHEVISEIMEEKLKILQSVNTIYIHYKTRITQIAIGRGIRKPAEKLELILATKVNLLLHHRLYSVSEEDQKLKQLQQIWSALYLGSDDFHSLAEKALAKSIHNREQAYLETSLYVKIGGIIILLLWSITECLNNESYSTIWNDPTFAVFVCFGDLLLLLFMWCISMFVWKSSGIDFINILNLSSTEVATTKYPVPLVLKSFVDDVLIFLLSFILFNKVIRGSHKGQYRLAVAHVIPVLLTIYYCYRVFQPWESRKAWLEMLWKVLAAPLYPVEFRDGYIGDLLTSLVRVSVPFLFSILYVILSLYAWITNDLDSAITTSNLWWTEYTLFTNFIIPFLMFCPLWIRLLQCLRRSVETGNRWPHYGNALKYTAALLVISYGSFQPELRSNSFWIACFVFATIYQFLWDLFQDWGMLSISGLDFPSSDIFTNIQYFCNQYPKFSLQFRSKRLLGSVYIYYFVIIFNLAFRFAWTLTLLPPVNPKDHGFSLYSVLMYHVSTLIAALEIIRRMIWGFFRLEWEQIELMKKSDLQILNNNQKNLHDDKEEIDQAQESHVQHDNHDDEERNFRNIQLNSYDKMEISSPSYSSSSSKGIYNFEFVRDWTHFLPFGLSGWIDFIPLEDRVHRVRLVESFIFGGVVFILVLQSAMPAFFI